MKTIWNQTIPISKHSPLSGKLTTEVAVIGGGLAGMLTAYYLSQEGKQTVVLEADRIANGQTCGTTAKITSQHNLIYQKLLRYFGEGSAKLYAQSNQQAIAEYERLIRTRRISCDFEKHPAYLYTRNRKTALHREALAAKKAGLPAYETVKTELPFPVAGALCFPDQAGFHPLKFIDAISGALSVFEHTPVLSVKGHTLITPKGQVHAKKIIFACHYPFINIPGFYFSRLYQERSYVLALSHTAAYQGMYLGIDPDGLSFRSIGKILLLGGQSHRTGRQKDQAVRKPYEALAHSAHCLYQGANIIGKWSAQDCITLDGLPFIGRFSARTPDWYVTTGFGKWGMTLSMVSARLLTDLICGLKTPYESLYSPQRFSPAASAGTLVVHLTESAHGLMSGYGYALLSKGKKSHNSIMRCPHMGCRLNWNPAEATWDCPCHGSRFNRNGQLLSGPAQTSCTRHRLLSE